MVVGALLVSVYQRGKDVYMYIRPILLLEAALPPGDLPNLLAIITRLICSLPRIMIAHSRYILIILRNLRV
jgi:hypothetical protein